MIFAQFPTIFCRFFWGGLRGIRNARLILFCLFFVAWRACDIMPHFFLLFLARRFFDQKWTRQLEDFVAGGRLTKKNTKVEGGGATLHGESPGGG